MVHDNHEFHTFYFFLFNQTRTKAEPKQKIGTKKKIDNNTFSSFSAVRTAIISESCFSFWLHKKKNSNNKGKENEMKSKSRRYRRGRNAEAEAQYDLNSKNYSDPVG